MLVFQHQGRRREIHFAAVGLLKINCLAVGLDDDADRIGSDITNCVSDLEHQCFRAPSSCTRYQIPVRLQSDGDFAGDSLTNVVAFDDGAADLIRRLSDVGRIADAGWGPTFESIGVLK